MDSVVGRQQLLQRYAPIVHEHFHSVRRPNSVDDFKNFMPSGPYLLYVHVPFCSLICRDCPYSRDSKVEDMEEYADCLMQEIDLLGQYNTRTWIKPAAVYFGGGTPSLLPIKTMAKMMARLREHFIFRSRPEVTLEVNPSSLDFGLLDEYMALGVNRLSIGIQSFNDGALKEMGRTYTGEEARKIVKRVSKLGWNFNIDLMYGFDAQTSQMFYDDLDFAIDNGVSHIATYNLIRKMDQVKTERALAGQSIMYYAAREKLLKAGFVHYFINEYARSKETICQYTQSRSKLPIKENIAIGTSGMGGTKKSRTHYMKFKGRKIYGESIRKRLPPAFFLESDDPHVPLTVFIVDILRAMRKMDSTLFKLQFKYDPLDLEFLNDLNRLGFIAIENKMFSKKISLKEDHLFQYNVFYNEVYFNAMKAPEDPVCL